VFGVVHESDAGAVQLGGDKGAQGGGATATSGAGHIGLRLAGAVRVLGQLVSFFTRCLMPA